MVRHVIHRLSASGLSRGRHCLHWARSDVEYPPREDDEYTLYGTAAHRLLDSTLQSGNTCDPMEFAKELDDAATDKLSATYDAWLSWWSDARKEMPEWRSEVRVAWNVATNSVRLLDNSGRHREYGVLDPNEVPGTMDAVGVSPSDMLVYDWKFGYNAVEAPKTNAQLAFYGAAIAIHEGRDSVRVTIAKPSEDGVYVAEPAELDVFSFEATRLEIQQMLACIPDAEPVPGPWCDYCPMRGSCSATIENVAQIVSATSLVRKHAMSAEIQGNDHAAWLLTAIDSVDEYLTMMRTKLREYADKNAGILLPDGTVWASTLVRTERPDLEAGGALQAIYALGLTDAVKSSTTWAALKKAGGPDKAKAIREKLTAIGAIKESTHSRYETKPVKKARVA